MGLETVTAVNGSIILRLERDFASGATFRAYCIVHFALAIACCFLCIAAILAANRFILKAFFSIEFLFTGCELIFISTVSANKRFVLVHR